MPSATVTGPVSLVEMSSPAVPIHDSRFGGRSRTSMPAGPFAIALIGDESHSGDVTVCQDCGHMLEVPPHPHDLRPMPELQGEMEVIPMAVVCPECDNVVRITYPSSSSTPE
jgi:hypothetical protein